MEGINFIIDHKGNKKAVVIDLEKYGMQLEDFIDGIVASARKRELKRSLAQVRKALLEK